MKLHTNQINIERVGIEESNSFTIRSTAKSFEILSAGLYTDPIAAVIRELSCNAYDSHAAAGKANQPFLIHLPNDLEPYLSIRDFGVGLSDEDVLHLYTTYFDSTKTHSNDFIGALGLGSKSPFSYTKSYEVISRYEGIIRSYHMLINEHGIPEVVRMSTMDTNDANGLEVKIGIDPSDFNKVHQKTASVLKHFNVKPTIVGALHFAFDPLPTKTINGSNWMAFHTHESHYNTKFTAVQGNVQYKVTMQHMNDELSTRERDLFQHLHIVGYFDIGALEVAASREEIRYDTITKAALVSFVRTVISEITDKVIAECKEYDTYWKACIALDKLSSTLFGSRMTMYNIIPAEELETKEMLHRYVLQQGEVSIPKKLKNHTLYTYRLHYGPKRYSREKAEHDFCPCDQVLFLIRDVKTNAVARMLAYSQQHPKIKKIVVIDQHDHIVFDKDKQQVTNHRENLESEYDSIVQSLGEPQIHRLSELCPPIPKNKIVQPLQSYSYLNTGWYGYSQRVNWDKDELDVENGGLFFLLKFGSNIAHMEDKKETFLDWSPEDVQRNLKAVVRIVNDAKGLVDGVDAYTHHNMYGVTIKAYKKLQKDPNWIDAFDVAKKHLISMQPQIIAINRANDSIGVFDIMKCIKYSEIRSLINTLPKSSRFHKSVKRAMLDFDGMVGKQNHYSFCAKLYNTLWVHTTKVEPDPYFGYSDFNKHYPLFSVLETLPTDPNGFSKVLDYIKLMDKQ